jgi:hypothetical protein
MVFLLERSIVSMGSQRCQLSELECLRLVDALLLGVLTTGVMQPLRDLAQTSTPHGCTAASLYEQLAHGETWRKAIVHAEPPLPLAVAEILTAGIEAGRLDLALETLKCSLTTCVVAGIPLERLTPLLEELEQSAERGCMIEGCFQREFDHLLQRAWLEDAFEIRLIQEGNERLRQVLVGQKPIVIFEPTHSLFFRSLLTRLQAAAQKRKPLAAAGRGWLVHCVTQRYYQLVAADRTIDIRLSMAVDPATRP